jgi:hypothetical protein
MKVDAARQLEQARTMPQVFELVKRLVREHLGVERSGLMLGLSNLGGGQGHLVGGFFQVAGNMIVMNTFPLQRIEQTKPELRDAFIFHILLHEYIHSIGYLSEETTRPLVLEISERFFGSQHVVTELARGWGQFMPNLVYPVYGWAPSGEFTLEVVRGFDSSSTDPYIA